MGFDHRGFGKSEGNRGYIESLEEKLNDSMEFLRIVRREHPNLPIFASGQSMGGMTSYYLSLRNKNLFKGVLLLAPAIKNHIPRPLVTVICGLASILPKNTRLLPHRLGYSSKNLTVEEDVMKDEFAYNGRASFHAIKVILQAMNDAPATYKDYDTPFVVIQGALDKLVNPEGAVELY